MKFLFSSFSGAGLTPVSLFSIGFQMLFLFSVSVVKAEDLNEESVPTIAVESSTITDYTSNQAEVSTINHIPP